MLKLGSLFDGIGGFPLAGLMCGIKPVWSSEIEPFPLKVTAARFPDMKQLGSVTDINGAEVEPVDIITFGSPCQDLSVAGKQKGIHDGERSNLFFEAVRIIKEMRYATRSDDHIRPRFAVWENVPGAFSSNGGEDFKAVLEALSGVMQDGLDIPRPKKWNHAGGVVGNGWSIAWRVYDAQYWGVPQRRKRIYLVADFASERAHEILFERESVRGDSAQGRAAWEGTSTDAERSIGGSRCFGIDQQGGKGTAAFAENVSPTLCSDSHGTPHGVCFEPKSLMEENWQEQTVKNALRANASKSGHCIVENCEPICLNLQGNKGGCSTTQDGTAFSLMAMHGHDVHVIAKPAAFMGGQGVKAGGIAYSNDLSPTLKASPSGGNTVPDVCYPINTMVATCGGRDDMRTCFGIGEPGDPQFTLSVAHEHGVCYALQGNGIDRSDTAGCNDSGWRTDQMYTLNTVDRPAVCYDARGNGDGNTSPTLTGDHENRVTDYTAVCVGNGQLNQTDLGDKAGALNCMHDQQAVIHAAEPPRKYIVRRLTPTECARLQGFPDEWCEGLGGSDSAIYKAYGNGLALPCAYDVLRRIAKEYDQTPVLQSIHKD